MITRHLRQAEKHVALGRQHVAEQMTIVADLESTGADTIEARRLLANFQEILETHESDRDRIERELLDLEK